MITIKDIADRAGVSPTTVANVLHGRTGKMSKETLTKVQSIIDESNYVSNMGARVLGNYGSRIIGVIFNYGFRRSDNNILSDPFFGTLIGYLEREMREHGYYMMLYIAENIDESIKMANSWNVEGVIAMGCNNDDAAKMRAGLDKPLVFIDSYLEHHGNDYMNVGLDDFGGGYMMTNYLISQGHRRIAFLADADEPVGVDLFRLNGCKKALAEAGIRFKDEDYVALNYRKKVRHKVLEDFIHDRMQDYTALFFASDFYACDAVNFFHTQGINVPEDISVVGFDNNIFSEYCIPLLTTVQQKVEDKAKCSVDIIRKLIKGEECPERDLKLPVQLVIQNSVKKID